MFNQNIISNKFDLNLSTTLSSYNKHSSLLQKFVNHGQKKFYNIRPEETSHGLTLGNCVKFYFTFKLKVQMWVHIYQIFERDQIPIHHLWDKLNPNTDKWKIFELEQISMKISKLVKNWDQTICNFL
jgi:hypothetical protein